MKISLKLVLVSIFALLGVPVFASESASVIFEIPLGNDFSLPITNSILTAWIVALALIFVVRVLCGKPKLVPSKGQYVFETIIEMFKEILEPILGKRAFPVAFPLLICLFFFILAQNWAGLIPGVGTIGWHEVVPEGAHGSFRGLFRPHRAD